MNMLGGLAFVIAIIGSGHFDGTIELDQIISIGLNGFGLLAVYFLAFAGITKAAQMPFNSWLLGAMVAPTPVSALLHSSTMVKAGVFLIVKLSPVLTQSNMMADLGSNFVLVGPGFLVFMIGGLTFMLASFAAVSQSNAKRVLAYSTIANLGLIVACAGVGTPVARWAAIMLIIFHAVTKSLLFLSVGTAEHNIGSRDIEDMDGLFGRMPRLATFMIIGISAMFLAPFGMLVSKWAALQSFVESGNIWVVLFLCFGSAVTLFYWAKWLGKMTAIVAGRENIQEHVHKEEWTILGIHVGLVVLIALSFPLISDKLLIPMLALDPSTSLLLSRDNMFIMVVMVALILILPLLFYGRTRKRIMPLYMGGANEGDNLTFRGSMGKDVPVSLRNWYMQGIFNEKLINRVGVIITCFIFALTFSFAVAAIFYLYQAMGGVA
jgi:ech hydrogenase subunit A